MMAAKRLVPPHRRARAPHTRARAARAARLAAPTRAAHALAHADVCGHVNGRVGTCSDESWFSRAYSSPSRGSATMPDRLVS